MIKGFFTGLQINYAKKGSCPIKFELKIEQPWGVVLERYDYE